MNRLVVKIGSSLLTRNDGHLDGRRMARFAQELAGLRKAGVEVLLVTSGAISAGVSELGWKRRPVEIAQKQAAAAVGQPRLMEMYRQLFGKRGVKVAQLLLTREDFENRPRARNAAATLHALLKDKVIPIINENDTTAVEEIRLGDNDTLAAHVAIQMKADMLVLLTDVEGLMTHPPQRAQATLIARVDRIDAKIEALAHSTTGSNHGTGGMQTKIRAARMVTARGTAMVIADGKRPGILALLIKGKSAGTLFTPR